LKTRKDELLGNPASREARHAQKLEFDLGANCQVSVGAEEEKSAVCGLTSMAGEGVKIEPKPRAYWAPRSKPPRKKANR
jgi:hypothetical protein